MLQLIFFEHKQIFKTWALYAHEIFVSREFRTIFRAAKNSIFGPLSQVTNAKNAGVPAVFPNLTTLDGWNMMYWKVQHKLTPVKAAQLGKSKKWKQQRW